MNTEAVLTLFDREERREIEFPGTTKEVFPHLVRFVRPAPGMSFVLYSKLEASNADAVIAEQVDYFSRLGRPFNWKVFAHDRPPDLMERLVAHGLKMDEETDAIMALDVARAPESLLAEPAADVRRLTDRTQLSEVITILEEVWGGSFNWVHERMGGHMEIPGYLSIFVAYVNDVPASAGWTYYGKGHFAGLWGGSTLEAYRARGLYTALLAARVREAQRRGVTYLTIDAGAMSRPIVARHGFEVLTYATDCGWKVAEEDAHP